MEGKDAFMRAVALATNWASVRRHQFTSFMSGKTYLNTMDPCVTSLLDYQAAGAGPDYKDSDVEKFDNGNDSISEICRAVGATGSCTKQLPKGYNPGFKFFLCACS